MSDMTERPRILVTIANYGNKNDIYLSQLIQEYESMSFDVDLVVLSNIPKQLPSEVEVIVGLPNRNPWSLPFAHKQVFADRRNNYDLFIYSEDDILITENNLRAFLRVSTELHENEIAGFFRIEKDESGLINFPDVLSVFHWDGNSVRKRGDYILAHFTNEHAGCYVLSKDQLAAALTSGAFLVEPHEGKYDLACSAATDPYTQCGFIKLIPISHFDQFTVRHLSNRYIGFSIEDIGNFGVDETELQQQIDALLEINASNLRPNSLFETDLVNSEGVYSKNFYEPINKDVLSVTPKLLNNILSIGCGAGATEISLLRAGSRVVAIPLDSIVSRKAATQGVLLAYGDFIKARAQLATERFDCLLCMNVLQLTRDPIQVLTSFSELLLSGSIVIIQSRNMASLQAIWSRRLRRKHVKNQDNYEVSGMRFASIWSVTHWCRSAGLFVEKIIWTFPRRIEKIARFAPRFVKPFLASGFVILATKQASIYSAQ